MFGMLDLRMRPSQKKLARPFLVNVSKNTFTNILLQYEVRATRGACGPDQLRSTVKYPVKIHYNDPNSLLLPEIAFTLL